MVSLEIDGEERFEIDAVSLESPMQETRECLSLSVTLQKKGKFRRN